MEDQGQSGRRDPSPPPSLTTPQPPTNGSAPRRSPPSPTQPGLVQPSSGLLGPHWGGGVRYLVPHESVGRPTLCVYMSCVYVVGVHVMCICHLHMLCVYVLCVHFVCICCHTQRHTHLKEDVLHCVFCCY